MALNILGSRPWPFKVTEVMDYVTIRFPICGFLLVLYWNRDSYLQALSRYSAPKCLFSANRHCDITWPLPPIQNLGTYFSFSPHISYSLCHFYWAPMKNKGCLLLRPSMLKAKSSENFLKFKNLTNFDILGGLGAGPPAGTKIFDF